MEVYAIKDSKVVLGAGYDPTTKTLRLQLRTQPEYYYDYSNVHAEVYTDLFEVDSTGRYYNRNIKNHYSSKKVLVADAIASEASNGGVTWHKLSLDEFVDLVAERLLGKLAKRLA